MLLDASVPRRYEQVAEHLRSLIETGSYGIADRLPSVRSLSQQLKVSVTTVLEAYRQLEDRGEVEARPQSGYYVSHRPQEPESPPQTAVGAPISVGTGEFLMRLLRDFHRPGPLVFGAASPVVSPELAQRLGRCMARVARDHAQAATSNDVPPGCESLRVLIARRSWNAGDLVSPDEVMLTTGCQEALTLSLQATCRTGDTVAVESPTYYGYLQAIEMLGLKILEIPSDVNHGLSLAALRQSLDEVRVSAVLCTPNYANPTGACLSEAAKQELLEITSRDRIPIIEDDVFGDLSYNPTRPRSLRSFDREGRVLLCSSFSKTLAPGYRVGWVVAPPRYVERLHQLKTFTNLASPLLPALAIAEFLQHGGYDHHLRSSRRHYARQTHQMAEAVLRSFPPGTQVTRPKGGLTFWVQLPPSYQAADYYDRALDCGVTFAPGPMFSARGRFGNCLRLCSSDWSPASESALLRLAETFIS